MSHYEPFKQQVLDTCQALARQGYLIGTGGNVSIRIGATSSPEVIEVAGRGELAERDQLRDRLDVELGDPGVQGRRHLVAALADAREHDPVRRHPGGQRALQLAAGDDVGAGATVGLCDFNHGNAGLSGGGMLAMSMTGGSIGFGLPCAVKVNEVMAALLASSPVIDISPSGIAS